MSDEKGGPAFPVSTANETEGHQDGAITWQFPGMTLRDYFAAKAMQGLLNESNAGDGNWEIEAIAAYKIADAMLKERTK